MVSFFKFFILFPGGPQAGLTAVSPTACSFPYFGPTCRVPCVWVGVMGRFSPGRDPYVRWPTLNFVSFKKIRPFGTGHCPLAVGPLPLCRVFFGSSGSRGWSHPAGTFCCNPENLVGRVAAGHVGTLKSSRPVLRFGRHRGSLWMIGRMVIITHTNIGGVCRSR